MKRSFLVCLVAMLALMGCHPQRGNVSVAGLDSATTNDELGMGAAHGEKSDISCPHRQQCDCGSDKNSCGKHDCSKHDCRGHEKGCDKCDEMKTGRDHDSRACPGRSTTMKKAPAKIAATKKDH